MKLYFDTNIYFRPLDDRTQIRIFLESQAVVLLLQELEFGRIQVISSEILEYEINNSHKFKQSYVLPFLNFCVSNVKLNKIVIDLAQSIESKYHIMPRDALHIASAINGKVQFFLTCDDKLIAKLKNFAKIKVINPVTFIKDYYEK